ncbi:MAG: [FeFe] hydrogenase H-cluster radical SAM maturase HydE, partial [Cetobacterium sp.]
MRYLIDRLYESNSLTQSELEELLCNLNEDDRDYLIDKAYEVRAENYGKTVFFRGLIEISNICKCDCFYCGIRASNCRASRYRLSKNEILDSC